MLALKRGELSHFQNGHDRFFLMHVTRKRRGLGVNNEAGAAVKEYMKQNIHFSSLGIGHDKSRAFFSLFVYRKFISTEALC